MEEALKAMALAAVGAITVILTAVGAVFVKSKARGAVAGPSSYVRLHRDDMDRIGGYFQQVVELLRGQREAQIAHNAAEDAKWQHMLEAMRAVSEKKN